MDLPKTVPTDAEGITGSSFDLPDASEKQRDIYHKTLMSLLANDSKNSRMTLRSSGNTTIDSVPKEKITTEEEERNQCKKNVKIALPVRNGKLYKPTDILEAVKSLVSPEKIIGIGVLSSITEWNILVSDEVSARALVKKRKILLQDGTIEIATAVGIKEAVIRVQWLPMMIEDSKLKDLLEPFGKVEEIDWELYAEEELKGIRNGVRRVRLTLKEDADLEALPHRTKIEGFEVLCTVYGRKPRCLRCNTVGHFFKNCPQRKRNVPKFADKVRNTLPSEEVVPAPKTSPERMYEEIAKPLLKELDLLTESPALMLRSSSQHNSKHSELHSKKEDVEEKTPDEDNMDVTSPARNSEEIPPYRSFIRKRPLESSPMRPWHEDSDCDSQCSERSTTPAKFKYRVPPSKEIVKEPRKSLEEAEENYLEAICKIDQEIEFLGPEMQKRVKEALELFTRKPMTLNMAFDPGTAANRFRRKSGIYSKLQRIERLHEDYRKMKFEAEEETGN